MSANFIDLRSDTVTRPTPAMLDAIASARLGDDVLEGDPTVRMLEDQVADLLGKEAACFVPSGTMANQIAIRAQTEPGDEIIAHHDSHIIHYEAGAYAAISGCTLRPLATPDGLAPGTFLNTQLDQAIRPDDPHCTRSRLVLVENTHNRGGGAIWPTAQRQGVIDAARSHGLRAHLDGARLWNAHVASGEPLRSITSGFDSVSVCFSKGLGAPVGSAVAGSHTLISRARRFRKMMGGAMRQSGLLAAACIYALEHNIARLADDHAHATMLARGIAAIPGLSIERPTTTNMVYFKVDAALGTAGEVARRMTSAGVAVLDENHETIRAVTHLHVATSDVERALECVAKSLTRTV